MLSFFAAKPSTVAGLVGVPETQESQELGNQNQLREGSWRLSDNTLFLLDVTSKRDETQTSRRIRKGCRGALLASFQ